MTETPKLITTPFIVPDADKQPNITLHNGPIRFDGNRWPRSPKDKWATNDNAFRTLVPEKQND